MEMKSAVASQQFHAYYSANYRRTGLSGHYALEGFRAGLRRGL